MEQVQIISLGAGVQSSTMALMAAHGEIDPMPECAIFADTGDEPKAVYEWLNWLESRLPFPVVRVSAGKLSLAATTPRRSANGGYLKPAIPVRFGGAGIGQRHCTLDFKITPVLRFANLIRGGRMVSQWLGISADEAMRMKPSRKDWCANRYPLIEKYITRGQCLEWMEKKGYPKPPRSACVYCPFHSDAEWLRLKTDEPDEFAKAVAFEKAYQNAAKVSGAFDSIPYLHESHKPLEEVEFDTNRTRDLFGNECEGMCGV
jgi:hypothetical protein